MARTEQRRGSVDQGAGPGVRVTLLDGTVLHRDPVHRELCGRCEQLHRETGRQGCCRVWHPGRALPGTAERLCRWPECLDAEEALVQHPTPTS